MCYLLLSDGSSLFREPVPEDFAWHCMFAALERDIKLTMLKASSCTGLFLFPVSFFSLMFSSSICSPGVRLTVVCADIIFNCKALVIHLHPAAKNASFPCGSTRFRIAICTMDLFTGYCIMHNFLFPLPCSRFDCPTGVLRGVSSIFFLTFPFLGCKMAVETKR